jgi:hypothetical protein
MGTYQASYDEEIIQEKALLGDLPRPQPQTHGDSREDERKRISTDDHMAQTLGRIGDSHSDVLRIAQNIGM